MKKIDISTRNHPNIFALVDDIDYESLNSHKWYPKIRTDTMYAARVIHEEDKQVEIRMHRAILKCHSAHIDHRDRNGLNNQRYNLRPCENWQNAGNRKQSRSNSSGYRGVSWCKQKRKWRARLFTKEGSKHLGFYINKITAAIAFDKAAKKHFGEFYTPQIPSAAMLCKEQE